ncbi:helix-turn-helix transcriptional regulator [Natronorubrum thiooxidans]
MVSTFQIGAGTALRSISTDGGPALVHQLNGQTVASALLRTGNWPAGLVSWLSVLRNVSVWEAALIVVLFLLIGGLVGVRLAETMSKRTLEVATLLPVSTRTAESPAADEPADVDDGTIESKPTDSSPTKTDSYAQYFSPETPPELLSDEGLVVRLLVANQGRIRQHRIAEETGWSKSKVSRICSQMHDDEMIEKISAGRENVIRLSERSTEATQSDEVENPGVGSHHSHH